MEVLSTECVISTFPCISPSKVLPPGNVVVGAHLTVTSVISKYQRLFRLDEN